MAETMFIVHATEFSRSGFLQLYVTDLIHVSSCDSVCFVSYIPYVRDLSNIVPVPIDVFLLVSELLRLSSQTEKCCIKRF